MCTCLPAGGTVLAVQVYVSKQAYLVFLTQQTNYRIQLAWLAKCLGLCAKFFDVGANMSISLVICSLLYYHFVFFLPGKTFLSLPTTLIYILYIYSNIKSL